MQVFNLFFKLLKANRGMIGVYFLVFIGMIVILTNIQTSKGEATGFTADRLAIGIIDEDNSVYSEAIKEYFGKEHDIREVEDDREALLDELYWKSLDYVLVIPKGFCESLVNPGIEDMELSNMKVPGYFDSEFFESELSMYHEKLITLLDCGYSMEEATEELMGYHDTQVKVSLASFVNQNQNDVVMNIFRYFPYLFTAVGIISVGIILVRINEQEVKDRTECSATTMRSRTMGIFGGIIAFGLLLLAVAFLVALILSKGLVLTDARMPFFMLNTVAILFFSMCLAFFAGTVSKSAESLNGLVNVFSLVLCFLGGVFVPQEFMGEGILRVVKIVPTYWYIRNNDLIGAMAEVNDKFLQEFLLQCSIMLLAGAVIFAVNLVILNAKRKRNA